MTQHVLAIDLGGTKTLLLLQTAEGVTLIETRYENSAFSSFESILATFYQEHVPSNIAINIACVAIAGVINGDDAELTNLPWRINAHQLAEQFKIGQVLLINDFAAVGEGISALSDEQLIVLQTGRVNTQAPRAVIGAGTGLGQAFMTPTATGWQVWSTEGGHTDFAPINEEEQSLLSYLFQQWSHVSYERLVSGMGLVTLYEFFCQQAGQVVDIPEDGDGAAWISEQAALGEAIALQTVEKFVSVYGAQAGNLALTIYPQGGLYIAGGIALKNIAFFQAGQFMNSFLAKGRMSTLLTTVPVYIINDPAIGLRGALKVACRASKHHDDRT